MGDIQKPRRDEPEIPTTTPPRLHLGSALTLLLPEFRQALLFPSVGVFVVLSFRGADIRRRNGAFAVIGIVLAGLSPAVGIV